MNTLNELQIKLKGIIETAISYAEKQLRTFNKTQ